MSSQRPWNALELEAIRVAYEEADANGCDVDLNELSRRIRRGKSRICQKARQLGLTSRKARTNRVRTGPLGRPFSADELAFFQVPRTWEQITARFGRGWSAMNAVIEADCDGGRGLLWWHRESKTWRLTDAGREETRSIVAA